MLSSDFLIRISGAIDGFRIPDDRKALNDSNAEIIFKKEGLHQNLIDVNHCFSLSSSFLNQKLHLYSRNVLYLDISYTKCNDLTQIFNHCVFLKGLNISGLELLNSSLKGIQNLYNIEILCLRSSKINDIVAISELPCLRSIDLGYTNLNKIKNSFENKPHLEEILLDYCKTESVADLLSYLRSLDNLKSVNLIGSSFEPFLQEFYVSTLQSINIEKSSRRKQFFEAVIRNDFQKVYQFITTGQDINMRATLEDEEYLTEIWREKCIYESPKVKLQTPFFVFSKEFPEEYFPSALHLALFFNSFESLSLLLQYNIDTSQSVYFSEVIFRSVETNPNKGYLIENSELDIHRAKSIDFSGALSSHLGNFFISENLLDINTSDSFTASFQRSKLFNPQEFVKVIYTRNVHRLTDDMVKRKISNWKSICERFKKRLEYILSFFSSKKETGNQARLMTIHEMDLRGSFALDFQFELESESMSRNQSKRNLLDQENQDEEEVFTLNLNELPLLTSYKTTGSQPHLIKEVNGSPTNKKSLRPSVSFALQNSQGEDNLTNKDSNPSHDATFLPSEAITGNKGKDLVLPKKDSMITWKDNGMIQKISGPPTLLQVPKILPTLASNWMTDTDRVDNSSLNQNLEPVTKQLSTAQLLKQKMSKKSKSIRGSSTAESSQSPEGKSNISSLNKRFEMIEISLLGKKDFWLESYGITVREREDKNTTNEMKVPAQSKFKALSLMEKKEYFLKALHEDRERKFIQKYAKDF